MNDILPPNKRPKQEGEMPHFQATSKAPVETSRKKSVMPEISLMDSDTEMHIEPSPPPTPPKKPSKPLWKRWWVIAIGVLVVIVAIAGVAGNMWYQEQISPLSPGSEKKQRIEILAGATPEQIADELEAKKVIRSAKAFSIYLMINGGKGNLQAGIFLLSPSESVASVVEHLTTGKVEELSVTFYPGGVLRDPSDTPLAKKTDAKTQLANMGFTEEEIEAAFVADYESNGIFAGRPSGKDVEGYIYGDTYSFSINASAQDVIQRSIDELSKVVQQHDLIKLYKEQGLSLYEGITLASIIQREVHGEDDERKVAQVFLTRLETDMPLGADATFEYAARQTGQVATPALQSPYNTRIVKGLPPGPISSPGLSALLAVAHPADTDYLYFVSGDDEINYFSKTLKEHEENTRMHCRIKCGLE